MGGSGGVGVCVVTPSLAPACSLRYNRMGRVVPYSINDSMSLKSNGHIHARANNRDMLPCGGQFLPPSISCMDCVDFIESPKLQTSVGLMSAIVDFDMVMNTKAFHPKNWEKCVGVVHQRDYYLYIEAARTAATCG